MAPFCFEPVPIHHSASFKVYGYGNVYTRYRDTFWLLARVTSLSRSDSAYSLRPIKFGLDTGVISPRVLLYSKRISNRTAKPQRARPAHTTGLMPSLAPAFLTFNQNAKITSLTPIRKIFPTLPAWRRRGHHQWHSSSHLAFVACRFAFAALCASLPPLPQQVEAN
jgi:hypothetical protein